MESQSVQFWRAKAKQRAVQAEVQRLEAHLEQQFIRYKDPEQEEDAALSIQWLIAAIGEFYT
jgi:hypothetical protein